MALVGVELETLVSEPDALTTRPPPHKYHINIYMRRNQNGGIVTFVLIPMRCKTSFSLVTLRIPAATRGDALHSL